jgi:hypothetical protein
MTINLTRAIFTIEHFPSNFITYTEFNIKYLHKNCCLLVSFKFYVYMH